MSLAEAGGTKKTLAKTPAGPYKPGAAQSGRERGLVERKRAGSWTRGRD